MISADPPRLESRTSSCRTLGTGPPPPGQITRLRESHRRFVKTKLCPRYVCVSVIGSDSLMWRANVQKAGPDSSSALLADLQTDTNDIKV